ncbi:DEAD/DEAH box helicase [Persephonella sp.]
MVEIIRGATNKPTTSKILIDIFSKSPDLEGVLYTGYPILSTGEISVIFDALWISKNYGVIAFYFLETQEDLENLEDNLEELYSSLDGRLRSYKELRKGRKEFLVNIEVIGFAPNFVVDNNDVITNEQEFEEFIKNLPKWKNSELYDTVLSAIQSVLKLNKQSKRLNIKKDNSRGAKLRELERMMAVLDRNQEKAIIEYFDGVQRIRGLAGSGKTIVLAIKAAYLHALHPDWDIAVTFNTRSLKQQLKNLIKRFCIEKLGEEPDWNKVKVVNAWGSPKDSENEKGIYYDFCVTNGLEYLDFRKAQKIAGINEDPFDIACKKALSEIDNKNIVEKYDAILVDEAQDLSESFLKLCYLFLKGEDNKKRLIYAYDELQKLNEGSPLRNPKEFLISKNEDFNDQILRVCYRNPRPILVTAHALGFGIYRRNDTGEQELVQFFDQPELWEDVGYKVEHGKLVHGEEVVLYRPEETSPRYLESHSPLEDLIIFRSFKNIEEQAEWVAQEIKKNLEEDELLHSDIVVINPISLTTSKDVALIRSKLWEMGINSHIAGEVDANIFFENESITFSGIYRAKGNEVPMVYIINAHETYSGVFRGRDLIRRRNILFTAITRSKAWVRVVGIGSEMDKLIKEYEEIKRNHFKLKFVYPTPEEIERLNVIHRDISKEEQKKQLEDLKTLENILNIVKDIQARKSFIEDYPEEFQEILKKLMGE